MFELVKEIPVTFGPHQADWWLVWLTAGSIMVSGVLGWFAFWNGRKATEIAERAEQARIHDLETARAERAEAAAARQEFERALRLDDAISEFFLAASRYAHDIKLWLDERTQRLVAYSRSPDRLDYPPEPSQHALNAALENMILRAGPDDSPQYEYLRGLFREILDASPHKRGQRFDDLVTYVSLFRSGGISSSEFIDLSEAAVWGTQDSSPTQPDE